MLDQRESNPNSTSEPKGTSPWHRKAVDMAVQCHCPPDFSEPRMYFWWSEWTFFRMVQKTMLTQPKFIKKIPPKMLKATFFRGWKPQRMANPTGLTKGVDPPKIFQMSTVSNDPLDSPPSNDEFDQDHRATSGKTCEALGIDFLQFFFAGWWHRSRNKNATTTFSGW